MLHCVTSKVRISWAIPWKKQKKKQQNKQTVPINTPGLNSALLQPWNVCI